MHVICIAYVFTKRREEKRSRKENEIEKEVEKKVIRFAPLNFFLFSINNIVCC